MTNARQVVEEHLDAFNTHDTPGLLAGFTTDAVWATGRDVVRGREALTELFDDGLWQLEPNVQLRSGGRIGAAKVYREGTADLD